MAFIFQIAKKTAAIKLVKKTEAVELNQQRWFISTAAIFSSISNHSCSANKLDFAHVV
jgi:hypothetical protein